MEDGWFLTISPPVKNTKPEYQFIEDLIILKKLRLCTSMFIIYPELSPTGRLHYHGIVYINDKIKWFKSVLPSLRKLGFCDLKPTRDFKNKLTLLIYCKKEWPITKEILGIDHPFMRFKNNSLMNSNFYTKYKNNPLDNGISIISKLNMISEGLCGPRGTEQEGVELVQGSPQVRGHDRNDIRIVSDKVHVKIYKKLNI